MVFFKSIRIPSHQVVAASGWLSRIVMAGIQVVSIPLILRYVGVNDFAVFAVFTGLVIWFNLADFGLGISIQNHISLLRVRQENSKKFLVSIAIFVMMVGVLDIIVFSFVAPFLQHFLLKKLSITVPGYLLTLVGDFYILAALFGVSYKIFFAEQRGYWAYFYQAVGYLAGFLIILGLIFLKISQEKLLLVMLGWVIPQALCAFLAFLHIMPLTRWIRLADIAMFRQIFSKAWQYGMNALGAAFVLGVDYVIMTQLLNANDISVYNILNKIFMFMYFGYSAVLMALWPVLAEHYAESSVEKNRQANVLLLRNGITATLYVILGTALIFVFKKQIISLFSKTMLVFSGAVILLFGCYYITRVWTDTYATAIQSRNKIAFIAFTVPIQAIISIGFLYYFGKMYGLAGIVLGLTLCFLITGAWVLPVYHYASLRKMRE